MSKKIPEGQCSGQKGFTIVVSAGWEKVLDTKILARSEMKNGTRSA